ncbi:nuclear transport factor 2 family protein [Massilia oculi]|uniref:Nuclear transport factor 2 family protein n=1 Tax=Massilia hydrophila TaxID=3044279 RepID=A0ABS7YD69_9BURK|nr:nuclear transport factor 2 family protein [Massilia oculi]MCA1857650.1 nuclear transport factor 2 family protein [Massilia oculi]
MLKLFAIPLIAAVFAAPAIAQEPPSVTLPADVDQLLRAYERAWAANDAAGLAALFAPDGYALPSGQAPARGTDSIRRAYAGGGGQPTTLRALEYRVSGDLAYMVGAYGPAQSRQDFGKFVLVLRRVDGRWLIAADIENANQRMGPPQRPLAKPPAPVQVPEAAVEPAA